MCFQFFAQYCKRGIGNPAYLLLQIEAIGLNKFTESFSNIVLNWPQIQRVQCIVDLVSTTEMIEDPGVFPDTMFSEGLVSEATRTAGA